MKMTRYAWIAASFLASSLAIAQTPATQTKHLLVPGEEKGYRHESVSHAMAVVDLLGGDFDEHPWLTFDAPIIVEDPKFPGMQQWPHEFTLHDEIYQMKDFSRDKVRVLMRLDPCKLDLANPKVHRKDRDFAVTW